jgi:hypothetical protein
MTEIISRTTIAAVCGNRDAAMVKAREAAAALQEGFRLAEEAAVYAQAAHGASHFVLRDHSKSDHYRKLFQSFDPVASVDAFRRQTDARVWVHVLALTGLGDLMDRTAKEQLDHDLCGDVPEFSEKSALDVFESMAGDANLIFQRGVARAFIELDRRFKSHDGFKIGARVILTRVFDNWGSFNYHSRMRDTMGDIERVFAVLDGKRPDVGALARAVSDDRSGGGLTPRQSCTETPYFRVRCFQNGNAHLWFKRDDLVEKVNQVLADYYGEVLPDAPDVRARDPIKPRSGLPARDLSFYPTPENVVKRALKEVNVRSCHVLEPSAGTGNMVGALLAEGARVDAIEIDADRVAILKARHPLTRVQHANFLQVPPAPIYDAVVMNPPFYGTHWMDHVRHAWEFVGTGGTLVAILPATAEVAETAGHEAFRTWATKAGRGNFYDLPPESFAASGTRISTVLLVMRRNRW